MIEILPIKDLRSEDVLIFGSMNIVLASLKRSNLLIADGIVVIPPEFHLKTTLEHFDFGNKEVFEQSLILVKKEIEKTPVPEVLVRGVLRHKHFLVAGQEVKSIKTLWILLLNLWLEEIKGRLWKDGFKDSLTENLEPRVVIFIKKVQSSGLAVYEKGLDEVMVNITKGKLEPKDLKKLDELILAAQKKLLIDYQFEWILDGEVKLTKVLPYTPNPVIATLSEVEGEAISSMQTPRNDVRKSATKVFLDFSTGLVVERRVDGIYIAGEKIFDLNKSRDSFEDLVFKLVECSVTFPDSPILFKLADKSEGMGKVRGSLRLLHQKSLFDPMTEALDFVRHKRGISNVHIVVPFVRGVNEFLQIKRELAVKKLGRKNSLQLWLEIAVPENIVNIEDYLVAGLDGIVLNMDELIAHLNGFDHTQEDLVFYKNEVDGLLKFLEDGVKLMHKSKIPFIALGSITLNPKVLDFLIEKGVYGMVVEKYEAPSAHDLLHQAEKRMILRKSS